LIFIWLSIILTILALIISYIVQLQKNKKYFKRGFVSVTDSGFNAKYKQDGSIEFTPSEKPSITI